MTSPASSFERQSASQVGLVLLAYLILVAMGIATISWDKQTGMVLAITLVSLVVLKTFWSRIHTLSLVAGKNGPECGSAPMIRWLETFRQYIADDPGLGDEETRP